MADNSDSRESENNSWVIAGSEALPVEELGSEAAEETQTEPELAKDGTQASPADSKQTAEQPDLEEAKLKDPEVVAAPSLGVIPSPGISKTTESVLFESDPSSLYIQETGRHDAEVGCVPDTQGTPLTHKAGPLGERRNASSSEEESAKERDVEGLRRRKGRDSHLVPPGASQDRHGQPLGGEESAFPGTKWLIGLLAILGLGLLVFSGTVDILSSWPNSDREEPHLGSDGGDWLASPSAESMGDAKPPHAKEVPPSEAPSDTQSLDAMGLVLDKLAKENQDIRLMQAELQSQKEELQHLLLKTEGEALAFTSQQQHLAAENARLAEALRRETAALLEAQAEVRLLRQKRQEPGREGGVQPQQPPGEEPGPERHPDKAERPEAEIRRLRGLLGSAQRDVARALPKVPPGEAADRLRDLEQRLGQELEQTRGEAGSKPSWRETHKARRGKETRSWQKQPGAQEERWTGHHEHGPGKDQQGHRPPHKAPKAGDGGGPHPRKHGPREAKPGRDGERHRGGRKAKKPADPSALWERLAQHPFRAPRGCAGVAECARQEGLAPVQKTDFLQMVQNYLAGLGWGDHYRGLAAALDGYFGGDGAFAHDRLSFVDFLDEVEDALEELAEHLGGSEEEVDHFEEVVLWQLGAASGGRFAQQNGTQRPPKERSREGHARKNGQEGTGRTHG
ncbi:pre-B-cell leukemia transcription factor-interacting protein 1 isoform X1 [Hemicordylus capensis]|uniref:pre-B-cell leukemia transcription factor-interacting protein 1 isoform X1 n=1 Tax=Hemicordylus capensis TaxID=884348 RepID=UPI002302A9BE|nr:pre-B-cell leukemia transcription factor-interacting protein 1 isoform X1 [Hemicordylus capensis]